MLRPVGYGDPNPPGCLTHGVGIAHALALHEPGEYVARLFADEAVVPSLLGDHREVPIGAPVERTWATIVGAGPLECHRFTDEADQVHAVADLLDSLVRYHAHAENSTIVTPVPPWFRGA